MKYINLFVRTASKTDDVRAIIKAYCTRLWRKDARPLDLDATGSDTISGKVVPLCISRHEIVSSTVFELNDALEREAEGMDTRLPLEITFRLEGKCIFVSLNK